MNRGASAQTHLEGPKTLRSRKGRPAVDYPPVKGIRVLLDYFEEVSFGYYSDEFVVFDNWNGA